MEYVNETTIGNTFRDKESEKKMRLFTLHTAGRSWKYPGTSTGIFPTMVESHSDSLFCLVSPSPTICRNEFRRFVVAHSDGIPSRFTRMRTPALFYPAFE
jgi:hypothetical protein